MQRTTSLLTTTALVLILTLPAAAGVTDGNGPLDPVPVGHHHIPSSLCFEGRPGEGHGGQDPMCPEDWFTVACASAALVVRIAAPAAGDDHVFAEGTSRAGATASANGGYSYSQSQGSGALLKAGILGGLVSAGTLESECQANAWAWDEMYEGEGCAAGSAAAQNLHLVNLGIYAAVLQSRTSACTYGSGWQDSTLVQCSVAPACTQSPAPNTIIDDVPGVVVVLNEQGTAVSPFTGKTLRWTAAMHVILDDAATCTQFSICAGRTDIYIGYTSVLA